MPGKDNASHVELVPYVAPSDNASATAAVARCHKALDLPTVLQAEALGGDQRKAWRGDGRHPLLHAVVASRPHIVLLLLGTNDAGELLPYTIYVYVGNAHISPRAQSHTV